MCVSVCVFVSVLKFTVFKEMMDWREINLGNTKSDILSSTLTSSVTLKRFFFSYF